MWKNIAFVTLLLILQNVTSAPTNASAQFKLDLQMDIALLIDWYEYEHVVKEAVKFVNFLMVGEKQVHVGAWMVGLSAVPIFPLTGDQKAIDNSFKAFQKEPKADYLVSLQAGLDGAMAGFATSGRPGVHKAIYYFYGNQSTSDFPTANVSWKSFEASGGTLVMCAFNDIGPQQKEILEKMAPSYSCKTPSGVAKDTTATAKELQQQFNRMACGDTNGTCTFKSADGGCVELQWPTKIAVDRLQCLQLPELKTCENDKCNSLCNSILEDKTKTCSGKCGMQSRPLVKGTAQWLEGASKVCQKEQCKECPSESGFPTWAIIVIVAVCLLLLIVVIVVVIMMSRRKKNMLPSRTMATSSKAGKPVESKSVRAIVDDDRTAQKVEQSIGVSFKLEKTEKPSKSIKGASSISKVSMVGKVPKRPERRRKVNKRMLNSGRQAMQTIST